MTPPNTTRDAQLERAIAVIRELRRELEAVEKAKNEPIAIIGLGLRLPGDCDDAESLWRFMANGGDAVTGVPPDRERLWHGADPIARHGGFIHRIDQFDAEFFGISRREAERMDPQQRLMLEVVWQALEDAGQDVARLRGSATGAFIGIHSASSDYYQFQVAAPERIDTYTATGGAHDVVAGRLSYTFDWHGPSLVVNTACSSSLVAVHLACQALRSGDCTLAVAGGVNLLLTPGFSMSVVQLGMLSPDGRCKAFDERANGFVRAEGCGAVILKHLRDAIADEDRILAVIRGTAVNQDGRSNGLTAPNGLAQEQVIREALRRAGVQPESIDFVETHGTGTPLGDPIESEALTSVLGGTRVGDTPCWLGSVKANLGHLEACAGVAGLIKAVLCLEKQAVPPLAHFRTLNPHIRLDGTPFVIPRAITPWTRGERPRLAGVSSFGWSGVNAHAVLEEAPASVLRTKREGGSLLLAFSAQRPEVLRETAQRFLDIVRESPASIGDICYSAAHRRSHHAHRIAVVRKSAVEFAAALKEFVESGEAPGLIRGRAISHAASPALVFTGQGAQYWGMGRELFRTSETFRKVIEDCAARVSRMAGFDLITELQAEEGRSRLGQTRFAQPALFALQAGLVEMWKDWGLAYSAAVGHSAGEIAAAYAAGILDLDEAVRIACERGRIMQSGEGRGAMISVAASVETLVRTLPGLDRRVAFAALNAPNSTVLSGGRDAIESVSAVLAEGGFVCRRLPVASAFHSPHMDACRDEMERSLGAVRTSEASVTFLSTVTGNAVRAADIDAAYWARGIRQPVRFAAAIQALLERNVQVFLEVGPHPVLCAPVAECAEQAGQRVSAIATLRRGKDDSESLMLAAGNLYAAGCPLNWGRILPGRPVSLPGYPFQRKRYWLPDLPAITQEISRPAMAASKPRNWRYEIQWKEQAAAAPVEHARPDMEAAAAAGEAAMETHRRTLGGVENERGADLEKLALAYARTGLARIRRNGLKKVAPHHQRLLERLERMVGQAQESDDSPEELARLLVSRYPGRSDEFELLAACGRCLPEVVADERNALDLLFPGKGRAGAAEVYANSPVSFIYNQAVREAIRGALCGGGEGRPRVLEIGAGTGGVTDVVLDALPAGAEYVCTDISRVLVSEAETRFGGRGNLRFRVLDIEGDPRAQGFEASSFDLILCANVLHATADLRKSLEHIRQLLAPGGVLVLVEVVAPRLWADLTFGLTEGWWRFQDHDLRPNYALLSESQWTGLLNGSGFEGAIGVGGDDSVQAAFQQSVLLARRPSREASSEWLVFGGSDEISNAVLRAIRDAGEGCTLVAAAAIDRRDKGEYRQVWRNFISSSSQRRGVIFLWGPTPAIEPREDAAADLMLLVQAAAEQPDSGSRIWVVTHHAQDAGGTAANLAAAPIWGLGRVIALEHPAVWGGLIDIAETTPAQAAAAILGEVRSNAGEEQVAIRGRQRYLARLQRTGVVQPERMRLDPEGTYVITGGLGAVGPRVARWLIDRGGRKLVLISRSGMGSGSVRERRTQLIEDMRARGAEVEVIAADAADATAMRRAFDDIRVRGGRIKGICHAAVDLHLQPLLDATPATLSRQMAAKAQGAWNLHRLSSDHELDFFLLFSSAAAVIGARKMSEYAAANEYLGALAGYRRSLGLPALTVDWGAWEEIQSVSDADRDSVFRAGYRSMPEADALRLMEASLAAGGARCLIADIDWQTLKGAMEARREQPFLSEIQVHVSAEPDPAGHGAATPSLRELVATAKDASEKKERIEEHIYRELRRCLGLEPSASIDPEQGLFEMGLDSLMSVQFRREIESATALDLPNTLIFSYPNAAALTRHLYELLVSAGTADEPVAFAEAVEGGDEDLDGLSEAELNRLLAAEVQSLPEDLKS